MTIDVVSATLRRMARPTKRPERKAQLLQTAVAMIEEHGVERLRVRDVAEATGVSTAAIHYYFNDLDGLLAEVHTLIVDRFISERRAAIAAFDDARDQMAAMIRGGVTPSADDAVTVAAYQVGISRRKNPGQVSLRSSYNNEQVMLYVGILGLGVGQGHFTLAAPDLDIAQNLVALEDAYDLHIISRTAGLPPERCAELMFSYARSATGCPQLGAG